MHLHAIHWEWIIFGLLKLIKAFGLIPGAFAALGLRKLYQKWRQSRAMAGWPATDATIQSGQVHKQGKHVHRFRNEEAADEFVRQIKDKHVLVHYDSNKPDTSVILDRDLEMIALLTPQYR